jgi:transposase
MPRKIDEAGEHELVALLEEKSHSTLAELVERLEHRRHVHVSVSTMARTLERMEITRKKGRWVPASRTARTFNRPARTFKIGRGQRIRAA